MFSIVATETSVLTFISVPGIAYRGNWNFLQLALGYIFGRILVSLILIPLFFKYGVTSIYELLGQRFNKSIQKLASATFLFTRILADGVRFAAVSIIIQSITNWPISLSIIVLGVVTLIYTVSGGLKTVIHIDAFQFLIYLISAIICIVFLLNHIDLSLFGAIEYLKNNEKLQFFNFSNNILFHPFSFISAFIGGTMLSLSSHGADYMMVQRVLATKDISSAKKAMIGSGIFVFIQFSLFLFIGSLIYVHTDCYMLDKDQEIAYVINNILPVGFKGLVIAGVLSAAMSTLSSSINSLSSSLMRDWFPNLKSIKISRIVSIIFTIVLILFSLIFRNSNDALVIIGLKVASFTYGALLSFFILSKIDIKIEPLIVFLGYVSSIIAVFYFIEYQIAWTFYIIGSVCINLFIVLALYYIKNKFLNYLFSLLLLVSIYPLLSTNHQAQILNTNIIDFKIKSDCVDNNILLGSDIFRENVNKFEQYKNIGIVVNNTSEIISIDESRKNIKINLSNSDKVKKIFTPEHGLSNNYQAGDVISNDNSYNIPIISLYDNQRKPNLVDLENIDMMIFDIQDIGSRYYTYISTMTYIMEACSEKKIPLFILDRPNPIGGKVDGPVLDREFSSFVGMHPIPISHGMTIGELAFMINELKWHGDKFVDLNIIKMQGWNHGMYFEHTGKNWIPPSPNIPDNQTAFLYQGACLLEGTNISEGRGTDMPFKYIGAPWINSSALISQLKQLDLGGVSFREVSFIPKYIPGKSTNPKFKNQRCNGIEIVVYDRSKVSPVSIFVHIIDIIANLHKKEFKFIETNFIDKLYGSNQLREYILDDEDINSLIDDWSIEIHNFKQLSAPFLIYE